MQIFFIIPSTLLFMGVLIPTAVGASFANYFFTFIANHKIIVSAIIGVLGLFLSLSSASSAERIGMRIFKFIVSISLTISLILFLFGFSGYFLSKERSFFVRIFGALIFSALEMFPFLGWGANEEFGTFGTVMMGLAAMGFSLFMGIGMYIDYAI